MNKYIGCFATSLAGHDHNNVYIIVDADDEYVYLADGKLKKGQRNNSGTNLSLKMSVLWRNCKCRKETFYGTQWNLQGVS